MLDLRKVTWFDQSAPGWAEWKDVGRHDKDEFSFFEGDEEVARARILPRCRLEVPYEGLRSGAYVAVQHLVVRDGRRCKGVGRDAVALLISQYQGQDMIAFSVEDRFWTKAGWVRAVRRDGDDFAMTLFIHRAQ